MVQHQTCIERLVIAYFGLCETVTGKSLDEEASEAELLEEVLLDFLFLGVLAVRKNLLLVLFTGRATGLFGTVQSFVSAPHRIFAAG
jgi:hypothetical protein